MDKVKVRLTYLTPEAVSKDTTTLKDEFGVKGPFFEFMWVSLLAASVLPLYECFLPVFRKAKESGRIPEKASLVGFKIDPMSEEACIMM